MTATPRPRTGPAVWKAAAAVLPAAVAAALPDEPLAVALRDGVLVPEIAVTETELEAEAEADADADAEADEEADALEFAAPQSGVVFKVTPAPLQRASAKEMVAESRVSHGDQVESQSAYFGCRWHYRQTGRSMTLA